MTPSSPEPFHCRFLQSIAEIDSAQWNVLAGGDYPFIRHEFLRTLEESGCTTAETGWQPFHAVVEKERKGGSSLVAAMPLFIKTHSWGEYVFDWSWVDAYHRHGLDYYPKLVTAIPFTPSPGPRICISPQQEPGEIYALLSAQIRQLAQELKASSWHVLFLCRQTCEALRQRGLQRRVGCQYQWFNQDYQDFAHFLQGFASRKRKNVKKERAAVVAQGIEFEALSGAAIKPRHWREFYRFYRNTYFVRGRTPYLSEDFFHRIGAVMADSLLLVMARKGGRYVAGAMSFIGAEALFGRYWGCDEEHRFLHFETCYYQGIEFCIKRGLGRFDPGVQGEHKIQRGFEPVLTYSNHWLAHPDFSRAIGQFLEEEERYMRDFHAQASARLPYRQTD